MDIVQIDAKVKELTQTLSNYAELDGYANPYAYQAGYLASVLVLAISKMEEDAKTQFMGYLDMNINGIKLGVSGRGDK